MYKNFRPLMLSKAEVRSFRGKKENKLTLDTFQSFLYLIETQLFWV